jgi:hypothetical protein
MHLGKLLLAGKSVVSGHKEVAYRINKNVHLPKFGSPKNPFTSPGGKGATDSPTEPAAAPVKKGIAAVAARTQKLPAFPPASRATAWTRRLNPISLWRGSETPAPDPRPPVQGELSLDAVKVVQNDLSDADVEVVPIKSRPARETDVPVLPPAEKAWEILGERFMAVRTS